jgi:hypothetical protein
LSVLPLSQPTAKWAPFYIACYGLIASLECAWMGSRANASIGALHTVDDSAVERG